MAAGKKEKKVLAPQGKAGSPGTEPERRVSERFPTKLQARIFYGNVIYTGVVTNLSKSGMFVNTKIRFPVNSELMMVVLMNNCTVKVPIKVRRAVQNIKDHHSSICRGIGVELLEAPQNYLELLDSRNPSIHHSS